MIVKFGYPSKSLALYPIYLIIEGWFNADIILISRKRKRVFSVKPSSRE